MKENKKRSLRNYKTQSGKTPFLDWLNTIKDPVVRHRIRRRLDRVELGNFGDYKILDEGVCELRLDFGPGFRVYFAEEGDVIVILLCGGDKSTQEKDIKTAKKYWKELLERSHE